MSRSPRIISLVALLAALAVTACATSSSLDNPPASTQAPAGSVEVPEFGVTFAIPALWQVEDAPRGTDDVRRWWLFDPARPWDQGLPRPERNQAFQLTVYRPGFDFLYDLSDQGLDETIATKRQEYENRMWTVELASRVTIQDGTGVRFRAAEGPGALWQEAYLKFTDGPVVELKGEYSFAAMPREDQEAAFSAVLASVRYEPPAPSPTAD